MCVDDSVRGQQVVGPALMVNGVWGGSGGANLFIIHWFLHQVACVSVKTPFP